MRRGGRLFSTLEGGSKTRKREVGISYVNDADIGAAVIAKGLARDCARYSGGRYVDIEKPEAKHLAYPGYCLVGQRN